MGLFSFFKSGNYFDKNITPKCDYCRHGKRSKDGNKVICEQRGIVDTTYSCNKFIYSPLKRIPVKQLNFVGSLADEDLYSESIGDRAEKEQPEAKPAQTTKKSEEPKKKPAEEKNAPASAPAAPEKKEAKTAEVPANEAPAAQEKSEPEADTPAEEKTPSPDKAD